MLTFQDFEKADNKTDFLQTLIGEHLHSDDYKTALSADNYDHQKNELINEFRQLMYTAQGAPIEDYTASNNRLASNFFHRLNTQRCTYLLGNGVSFTDNKVDIENEDGVVESVDTTKEKLGDKFDTDLKKVAYKALIHGVCFGFWNLDRLYCFPITEFVPLWDEENGSLRAGIRFYRIDNNKPMWVVLYEEDGYTKYKTSDVNGKLEEVQAKRAYKTKIIKSPEGGEDVIGFENYNSSLPIIPLWGSDLHQSTLVGMKEKIDSYDLIRSGFANDLTDCAQIYWILENCAGMSDGELEQFRDRLKFNHIAVADTEESKVTPYTQEPPYAARKECLDELRAGLYEDFGGLDVHTIAAGATNDHIDAAYQPMDEEADDFEFQIINFIQEILALIGIEDTPIFKRNRISNQSEQTSMVLSAADYLDDETILTKLPFISVDEVQKILLAKTEELDEQFDEEEMMDEGLDTEDLEETDESGNEDIISAIESLLADLEGE